MIAKLLELLDTALYRATCLVVPGVAVLLELLDTALSRATCLLLGHDVLPYVNGRYGTP